MFELKRRDLDKPDSVTYCIEKNCGAVHLLGKFYELSPRDRAIVGRDTQRVSLTSRELGCPHKPAPLSLEEFYAILRRDLPPIVQVVSDSAQEIYRTARLLSQAGIAADTFYVGPHQRFIQAGLAGTIEDALSLAGRKDYYAKLFDGKLTPGGVYWEGVDFARHAVESGYPAQNVGLWSKKDGELRGVVGDSFKCMPKLPQEVSDQAVLHWLRSEIKSPAFAMSRA